MSAENSAGGASRDRRSSGTKVGVGASEAVAINLVSAVSDGDSRQNNASPPLRGPPSRGQRGRVVGSQGRQHFGDAISQRRGPGRLGGRIGASLDLKIVSNKALAELPTTDDDGGRGRVAGGQVA